MREEIDRCGYTLTDAARIIGDPSSQNLRDVVTGRKKCPAELLARLTVIGVDISHILTGGENRQPKPLNRDEMLLLENYRVLPKQQKAYIKDSVAALAFASKEKSKLSNNSVVKPQ